MLQIILRCVHFFEYIAFYAWRFLTRLGHLAVLLLFKVSLVVINILKALAILGQEFQNFVSAIKQSVDEIILTFRLIGNTITEFMLECLKCILNNLEDAVPTKENLEGTSINIVDLLLRSLTLIADVTWGLVTFLPRTIALVFVALGDLCVFGLDMARQCACYFLKGLVEDTMRTTLGLTVIIFLITGWRVILHSLFFLRMTIEDQFLYWHLRWRMHFRTPSFPQMSIRRSPRRSVSPADESKLPDQQRCVVCKYRGKCVLLWPCRHLCLCDECADTLNYQNLDLCPLCRTEIELTISVYV